MKTAVALFKYFAFGGLQLDTMRLVNELLARGHEVTLFTGEICSELPTLKNLKVELIPLKKHSNHARAVEFARIFHERTDRKFDLTIAMNRIPGCDFYFAADNCIVDEFLLKHSRLAISILPRYRTFARIEKEIFSPGSRTGILYLAERQKTAYQKRYGTEEKRFHLLPPGIPEKYRGAFEKKDHSAEIRKEFGISEHDFFVIFIGSNFRLKGLDRAVRILADLPEEERGRTKLLAVGSGRPEQILPMIRKYGLEKNVIFTGGRTDTEKLLPAADLLVLFSYSEATGTVIAESLCCGTPVLCSENCGFSSLAKDAGSEVVPDPWRDDAALALFRKMSYDISPYREKDLDYAKHHDFFRRAAHIVDLLEAHS